MDFYVVWFDLKGDSRSKQHRLHFPWCSSRHVIMDTFLWAELVTCAFNCCGREWRMIWGRGNAQETTCRRSFLRVPVRKVKTAFVVILLHDLRPASVPDSAPPPDPAPSDLTRAGQEAVSARVGGWCHRRFSVLKSITVNRVNKPMKRQNRFLQSQLPWFLGQKNLQTYFGVFSCSGNDAKRN